jgi:hypothetical protein
MMTKKEILRELREIVENIVNVSGDDMAKIAPRVDHIHAQSIRAKALLRALEGYK